MRKDEILKILPQREPMLMVDDILEIVPGKKVTGYKRVREDEIWVKGHFPQNPIFPGVLLIEHMAQTVLFLAGDDKNVKPILAGLDQVRFLHTVLPGMELFTDVKKISSGAGFIKADAVIYLDREKTTIAAKAKLTCFIGRDVE